MMKYGIIVLMALSGAKGFVSSPGHLPKPHSSELSMANNDDDGAATAVSSSTSASENENDPTTPSSITQKTPTPPPFKTAPSPELMMRALNTSPRRIFLGTLSSTGIALSANFFGVTSNLLNAVPEPIVESTGLDQIYPRGNYKRYKSGEYGYSFVVPKEWVQDTAVELAKIQRRAGNLDYSMRKPTGASIPDVAYGPPGYFNEKGISQSDTNLSTLATKLGPGISLKGSLGSPRDAAETLLRVSLTPEGSGKVGTLLGAQEERRGEGNVYTFEYKVDRGDKGVPLRAISIIAVQGGDTLITVTVVAPAKDWVGEYEIMLRKMADSFKLTR